MTIAAFAGAKGLGWFINLGLNSLNVEMILLGAVPVSLLALLFDFIFAKLEQAVTSEGQMCIRDRRRGAQGAAHRERKSSAAPVKTP